MKKSTTFQSNSTKINGLINFKSTLLLFLLIALGFNAYCEKTKNLDPNRKLDGNNTIEASSNNLDDCSLIAVCQAYINVSLDLFGTATLTPEAVDGGSYSDCGEVSLSLSQSSFDCSDVGDTIVIFLTVTDINGNTNQCWSEIIVEDKQGPTAVCNAVVNVSLDATGNASITPAMIDAGSYDNCSPLTFELSQSTFDCSDIGDTTIVLLTVTDVGGNTNQCWTQIIVEDKIAPDVTCPADLTLDCSVGENPDPLITGTPFVVDNCDSIGYSYEDLVFQLGGASIKILRTWTIVDWNSGSIQECIQVIKVLDTTPPDLVCLSQVNVALGFTGSTTITPQDLIVSVSDDCDNYTLTINNNQFDCSDIGQTQITVTASDGSGNISQCVVNVMIEDKSGPTAVCIAQLNVSLDINGIATITPAMIDAGSYDECGPVTLSLDQTMFDCSNIGDSIVVIMTVTDQSGNTNQCWTEVVVEDKLAPNIVCPPDLTLDCSLANNLNPNITGAPIIVDNCNNYATSYEDLVFSLGGSDLKVLRTWTVIDLNSGGTAECIQVIKLLDTSPPTIVCINNLSLSLDATGNLTLFPADFDTGTTDDCGNVTLTINKSQFDCADVGVSVVTMTATDDNGNFSQCNINLTISGLDSDQDGYSLCEGDCDDNDGSISPGAPETCSDNIDNNCNGQIDENCICASYGQSTEYEWIQSISINSLANPTGDDGGYGDYTGVTLQMDIGNNSVQLVPGFSGSKYKESWSIWIDFNHNGVFDTNEEVLNEKSKNTINSSIDLPATALLGPATMRISMKYNQYSDPCEIFPEGEVEDYTVNINAPSYCTSGGQSTQYEWIKKVKLKSINNQSGDNGGYADFTNLSTNLNPGQSKNIKLKPGFSGSSYLEYWRVWVDWNNDGDFDDAGELEVQTSSTGNITDQITVPNNASSGDKIMRVSMKYDGYADPCQDFTYGEVEDYTIFVTGNNPLIAQDNIPDAMISQNQEITSLEINKRDLELNFEMKVYPNPVSNILNINMSSDVEGKKSLKLYSQIGQIVFEATTNLNQHSIDISTEKFKNGMYILVITQGENVKTQKVLIAK